MGIVTTLKDKRREKQMSYERKMLRELSLEMLRKKIKCYFAPILPDRGSWLISLEEGCIDIGIESFLLGAHFSRFGFHGESIKTVKRRCRDEEKLLTDTLYDYVSYWACSGEKVFYKEIIYNACEQYVQDWWQEGFQRGEKRYRLRLH